MEEYEERSLPPSLCLEASAFDAASRALLTPGDERRGGGGGGHGRDAHETSLLTFSTTSPSAGATVGINPVAAVPRVNVMRALERHVAALGPPHTLVLTGVEGSGKSTAIATLVARLRASERACMTEKKESETGKEDSDSGAREGLSAAAAATTTTDAGDGVGGGRRASASSGSSALPPFVLAHTFADPSFSQDVSHFLERACILLKREFNIHDPIPADPGLLPDAFARFLEHAAMFRRVLVVVDGMECARVPPYASFAAAAAAGLDVREHHHHYGTPLSLNNSADNKINNIGV